MTKSKQNVKKGQKPTTKRMKSRFHNLKKLFINSILCFFTDENLSKIKMPKKLKEQLLKVAQQIRISGRKSEKKVCTKTDLFNHSHYITMYMTLNSENVRKLIDRNREIKLHKKCFGIELSNEDQIDLR